MPPDINLVDLDAYQRDGPPHGQFAWLRENAPVFWHADGGHPDWPGFWAVTRHADITHVSRHPEIYSSARRLVLLGEPTEQMLEMQRQMMLNMDPPRHTRQRSFVKRGFTPRMVGRLESRVREICGAVLDEVAARGEADFVTDIAAPLPMQVICELVGAPEADRPWLAQLSDRMIGASDPEFAGGGDEGAGAAPAAELYAYANDLARRRQARPEDDIVTRLLQPNADGDVLTTAEFDLFFLLLVVAGNETTRNAASGGMLAFFSHPAQWQRLLADPSLAATAAEEITRWVSPVNLFRRTAVRDTELGGRHIAEGDKVVVFYSSGNHDGAAFDSPSTFDIGRDPNPHVGFGGGGPHFCLGRHLAALELRVLLGEIAARMPDIRPAGDATRLRSNLVNGITHLPVRFTPRAAARPA